ncbi:MAG TPA: hypothetical protein PKD90_14080, partial [Phnomibacter sp.]|nr:hypothetical protein [Phnomibacter sp.]
YSRDTVFLGGGTFVVLDAGGRITHLREVTGLSNIADGDYYYTYNATNGTLAERIYDDGSAGPVERTRYIFTNDSLTRIEQDINGIANALIITLTYNNSSRLHGFAEYQYADFFPELIPYWSLLKLGRLPAWPLANSLYTVNIPPAPAFTLAIPFNGFTQTQPDGLLKSYSNTITVPGSGSTTYNYVLEYNCNP